MPGYMTAGITPNTEMCLWEGTWLKTCSKFFLFQKTKRTTIIFSLAKLRERL